MKSEGAQGEVSNEQESETVIFGDKPLVRSLNDGADEKDALALVDSTEKRLEKQTIIDDLPENFDVNTKVAVLYPLVACVISKQHILVRNMALEH